MDIVPASNSRTEVRAERPRYFRRLSDKVLIAFHQACDQDDHEIAGALLTILEEMIRRRTGDSRRKSIDSLVAAHERLWHLRRSQLPR